STHKGINITAPRHLDSLSGSCLLIPCSFTDDKTMKFDSRKYSSQQQLVKKQIWNQHNWKSEIQSYRGKYFFRVESGPFRSIATCDPVHCDLFFIFIICHLLMLSVSLKWNQSAVKCVCDSPRIEISGDVKEKNSVTIMCSALTPCPQSPPGLTFNLQPNPHRQMQKNKDGTFTTTIQQNITLSEIHDGYNIICFARYPVAGGKHKTANAEVTLSVSYAPKNTSAFISLTKGRWVELRCSSRAKPPVRVFTWFENTTTGAMKAGEGENYGVQVTEGKTYYCVATNDVGSQTS
uniref:Ig-like domain-containing protein n=1 Tax=Poecilia formosa TaxID=48698 RepID=A0A087Y4A1_POEFO